jgi:hypothetical protein
MKNLFKTVGLLAQLLGLNAQQVRAKVSANTETYLKGVINLALIAILLPLPFVVLGVIIGQWDWFPELAGFATHATSDGEVQHIKPHPAGGTIIVINGQEHYAYPGAKLSVAVGDKVEAGDTVTDGIPNPNEFIKHKGIGEGRRAYVDAFRALLRDNGTPAARHHLELVARGMANHVRMAEDWGQWLPDDIVQYDELERQWTPRADAKTYKPKAAIGSYLESPVLHYTIGTRVTPRVVKDLEEFKVSSVVANPKPLPFEPEYVSARETLMYDPDWQTRMAGSYLQKATLNAARTGAVSDEEGTSYIPALMRGTGFGTYGAIAPKNNLN